MPADLLGIWTALLDLVLPQECAGCRREAVRWCATCARELQSRVAQPLGRSRPTPAPRGFPEAAAAAPYDGVVRAALIAHKEQGRRELSRPLAAALAAAVDVVAGDARALLVVPVPSSRAAVRQRGQDHAVRLAGVAAQALHRPGRPARAVRLLTVGRDLADQAGLGAQARSRNLSGALRIRRPQRLAAVRALVEQGWALVVVDDVVTTGATLTEAARALGAAGLPVRAAATVAATARRSPPTWPRPVQQPGGGLPSVPGT